MLWLALQASCSNRRQEKNHALYTEVMEQLFAKALKGVDLALELNFGCASEVDVTCAPPKQGRCCIEVLGGAVQIQDLDDAIKFRFMRAARIPADCATMPLVDFFVACREAQGEVCVFGEAGLRRLGALA